MSPDSPAPFPSCFSFSLVSHLLSLSQEPFLRSIAMKCHRSSAASPKPRVATRDPPDVASALGPVPVPRISRVALGPCQHWPSCSCAGQRISPPSSCYVVCFFLEPARRRAPLHPTACRDCSHVGLSPESFSSPLPPCTHRCIASLLPLRAHGTRSSSDPCHSGFGETLLEYCACALDPPTLPPPATPFRSPLFLVSPPSCASHRRVLQRCCSSVLPVEPRRRARSLPASCVWVSQRQARPNAPDPARLASPSSAGPWPLVSAQPPPVTAHCLFFYPAILANMQ